MAKKYWLGQAAAVAQVTTVQITADDAATTYSVTVGDFTASVAGSGVSVDQTAADLTTEFNSTKTTFPHAASISATVATDTITFTADVAGVPFVITSDATGGTGTIGAPNTTTASAGPCHWDTAANWSDGVVPANTDDVRIENSDVNICYGLSQSAVTLASLFVDLSYTGKIGLPRTEFTTTADGETTDTTAREYRDTYLDIGADRIEYGRSSGIGTANGSSRIKIDNAKAGASVFVCHDTGSTADGALPAIRYLAANANADVDIREAPAGFGIGADDPSETSTIGDINITALASTTRVIIGDGVTWTNLFQTGGTNLAQGAADVTKVENNGGTLTLEGDFAITTLEQNSGTTRPNNVKTGADEVTTVNLNGGTLDTLRSSEPRTFGTVNHDGGTLDQDDAVLTITTYNQPTGRTRTVVSAAS